MPGLERRAEVPPLLQRLPGWMWAGGWGLAFLAGMINVVGLLGFEHQAVSHLTGTTSLLGSAVSALELERAVRILAVIVAFVLGAMVSGFVIGSTALELGRRYWVALLLESALLCGSVPLLHGGYHLGTYLVCCACGLQNAMATTYSGTVVRTTHLSGMFTDLGIAIGQAARGIPADVRRFRLSLLIISGFFLGGIAGAVCFRLLGYETLLIPGALTGTTAVIYGIYCRARR